MYSIHLLFFYQSRRHPYLHSFPTRRSSDLFKGVLLALGLYMALLLRLVQNAQRAKDRAGMFLVMGVAAALGFHVLVKDRKSTSLNSSHSQISYAVFCLKKKIKNELMKMNNR